MITVRRSEDRGHFDHGWLDTWHTFSFGDYHDPQFLGFRTLRVINEDWVQPGQGFPPHSHRDMEIVTYVLEGALEHKDSTGAGGVIRPGDVQRMSAGTGVVHSEYNHSATEAVHLLQIWILPASRGLEPSYEERHLPAEETEGRPRLIASPDGAEGSVTIRQDARILAAVLPTGTELEVPLARGRHAWVQVARGTIDLAGTHLHPGDGAAVSEERVLPVRAVERAEFLLFDLA
jgi:hypothetical protein